VLGANGKLTWTWYASNMAFVWQWTLMFMTWSWIAFLVALMLHVIKPFLPSQDPEDADKNVAIWFLAVLGFILPSYAWCTWWTGHVTRKLEVARTSPSIWQVFEKLLS